MIRLDCPGCNHVLELDTGFAGGFCRCNHCGRHILVPEPKHTTETTRPRSPLDFNNKQKETISHSVYRAEGLHGSHFLRDRKGQMKH